MSPTPNPFQPAPSPIQHTHTFPTPTHHTPTPSTPTVSLATPLSTTQCTSLQPFNLMFPRNKALLHPAAPMLEAFARKGCPVNGGTPWSTDQIQAYLAFGNHPSASSPAASTAIQKEVLERVKDGLCHLVPYLSIAGHLPRNLKLSPLAAIPHKTRQFRLIQDLSYKVQPKPCQLRPARPRLHSLPQYA